MERLASVDIWHFRYAVKLGEQDLYLCQSNVLSFGIVQEMRCGHHEAYRRIVLQLEFAYDGNVLTVKQLECQKNEESMSHLRNFLCYLNSRLLEFDFVARNHMKQVSLIENGTTVGLKEITREITISTWKIITHLITSSLLIDHVIVH